MTGMGLLGQPAAGADPAGWMDVLRHDVIPVASAYLVLLVLLAAYRRARTAGSAGAAERGRPWRASGEPPTWMDLARYLLGTALGGYAVFLAIVVVFYFVLGGEAGSFIEQALREGSALAFALALPALFLLGIVERRSR